MSSNILPPPWLAAHSFLDLARSGELWANLSASLRRAAIGFALGSAGGILLGSAMGASRRLDAWIGPIFRTFAQIPSLVWIPLLMVVFGVGEALKYVVLAKACLVPVAITTAAGVRSIPKAYLEVGRLLRLPTELLLRRVILRAALPPVFSGLRQGLASVWTSLVIVEMMASANGVGYLMSWARQLFQLDVVVVGIVIVGLIGFTLDLLLKRLEARLLSWRG